MGWKDDRAARRMQRPCRSSKARPITAAGSLPYDGICLQDNRRLRIPFSLSLPLALLTYSYSFTSPLFLSRLPIDFLNLHASRVRVRERGRERTIDMKARVRAVVGSTVKSTDNTSR